MEEKKVLADVLAFKKVYFKDSIERIENETD